MPDLQYVPMSYDEWWALPDKPIAEWVDGVAVVNSPARWGHKTVSQLLANRIAESLPDLLVAQEVGVQLPHSRVRVPDITVLERKPEGVLVCDVHVLVVEILSPSTPKYAGAGVGAGDDHAAAGDVPPVLGLAQVVLEPGSAATSTLPGRRGSALRRTNRPLDSHLPPTRG